MGHMTELSEDHNQLLQLHHFITDCQSQSQFVLLLSKIGGLGFKSLDFDHFDIVSSVFNLHLICVEWKNLLRTRAVIYIFVNFLHYWCLCVR